MVKVSGSIFVFNYHMRNIVIYMFVREIRGQMCSPSKPSVFVPLSQIESGSYSIKRFSERETLVCTRNNCSRSFIRQDGTDIIRWLLNFVTKKKKLLNGETPLDIRFLVHSKKKKEGGSMSQTKTTTTTLRDKFKGHKYRVCLLGRRRRCR